MSKRKPLTRVDKVLPNDTQIGQRNSAWRALMDKYSKCEDKKLIDVDAYLEAEPSEGSDDSEDDSDSGSEVITDDEADSDVENREEIKNQLRKVVDERKPVWKQTGLQQQMAEIEVPSFEGCNLPSRKKVEDWLLNRAFGAGGGATRHGEIIMSEQTKIEQHTQYLSMSAGGGGGGGDDDSLQSVDTASYILSSRQQCSATKQLTIIQKFTKTVAYKTMPVLEENALLPVAQSKANSPPLVPGAPRKACKSDSTLEKKDSKSKSSSRRRNVSDSPRKPEKSSKTQKKTFKKKAASRKKTDKPPKQNVVDQYEEALKNGAKAKKVARVYRPAKKRNEWRESDKSSSGEDNDEVFTKPKTQPKSPPRKKPSPRKIRFASPSSSTLSIVGTFDAINLATPQKKKPQSRTTASEAQDKFPPVDQTTNMTALFSDANEKIVNSTEIGAASTSVMSVASAGGQSRSNSTMSSQRSERFPGYRDDRALVVYKPKEISEHNRKIRVYGHQMDLSKVTRPRHLLKFQTFSCVIHTNSSIVFYPSDSEDELPDDSPSDSDSDDPLMSYRRADAPLRVVERGYSKLRDGR